jgi:hypothetical protein
MKDDWDPRANESSKQRALRIMLDYHRRGDALVRSKHLWTLIGSFVAIAYVAWLLFGGTSAQEQLSPGPLAAAHATLNTRCAECHQDFVPLDSDAAGSKLLLTSFRGRSDAHAAQHADVGRVSCAKCHQREATNPHHTNQFAADVESCAACHADHQGADANLVRPADRACTVCHADIARHRSHSLFQPSIQDAAQFLKSPTEFKHPAFRSLPKSDHNNFKFNHQLHILPGQWPKDGKPEGAWKLGQIPAELREQYRTSPAQTLESLVQLDCKSCHEAEQLGGDTQSGSYMRPIVFEQHCRACHPLQVSQAVDGKPQSWNIRHGLKANELREVLLGISARGEGESSAPRLTPNAPVPIPGKTPGNNLAQQLGDPGKVEAWEKSLLREQCFKCHAQETPVSASSEPNEIVKPNLPERWLAHARFNHQAHKAWANCRDCHAGAYATEAANKPPVDDDQVLIPNIDNCVQCHAPRSTHATFRATARFDCAECHQYHNTGAP